MFSPDVYRNHIVSSFESLDCFLLPYPGHVVAEDPHFKGDYDQLGIINHVD